MPYLAPIGNPRRALLEARAAGVRRAPLATIVRAPRSPAALDALGLWPFSSSDVAKSEGVLPPAVATWQAAVKARGNVVSRMPKGPNVGKLAERYIDASGTARYALASKEALEADGRGQAVLTADIAAGARVEQLEKGIRDVSSAIAAAPRNIAGAVLGIPPWLVTAIVLGAGALALKTVLPTLGVRHNPPRAEPVRRRRRRRSSRR